MKSLKHQQFEQIRDKKIILTGLIELLEPEQEGNETTQSLVNNSFEAVHHTSANDDNLIPDSENNETHIPSTSDILPTDIHTPPKQVVVHSLPFPLESSSLLDVGLFYLKNRNSFSFLTNTWTPVILFYTKAEYIHIYEIDPLFIKIGDINTAFSNIADRSRKGIESELFENSTSINEEYDESISGNDNNNTWPCQPKDIHHNNYNKIKDNKHKDNESHSTNDTHNIQYDIHYMKLILETENFMTPLVSINVTRSHVHFIPSSSNKSDMTFDIIETIPMLSGMKSLFYKETEKKVTLQATTQDQMFAWILRIEKHLLPSVVDTKQILPFMPNDK